MRLSLNYTLVSSNLTDYNAACIVPAVTSRTFDRITNKPLSALSMLSSPPDALLNARETLMTLIRESRPRLPFTINNTLSAPLLLQLVPGPMLLPLLSPHFKGPSDITAITPVNWLSAGCCCVVVLSHLPSGDECVCMCPYSNYSKNSIKLVYEQ